MRFYLLILLVLGRMTSAWTQSNTPEQQPQFIALPKISKIFVNGNRRTKPQVILREMKTQVGDTVDNATLQADQKRILNLGLFNRVEIDSLHETDGVHLLIGVTERLYLFPFPIFFINDKDWDKASYGAGLVHTNFRGRNEVAAISGWAGYNPAFAIDYSNPWLFGPAQLLTRFRFSAQRVRNRSFANLGQEVDEKRLGAGWSIGKRFGLFTYLSLSLGYTELKLDPPAPGQTLDPSGRDRLPSFGLTLAYDRRDLFEYPRSGVFMRLWGLRTGLNSEYIHFWRYGADVRGYQKLYRGLSLGARAMTDLSKNKLPIYERVFLGYSNRVRGHFNSRVQEVNGRLVDLNKNEGENLAMASVELRFPILPWRYFSISDAPMFGSFMQNMKFGISAGIFADYGRVWFQSNKRPRFADGQRGYGAGLHFHLPYVNLLRLELAFDEDGRSEWIADIGVAF